MKTAPGLVPLLALFLAPALVRAQEPVSDALCLLCHEVAPAPEERPVHREVTCVQCHAALASYDPGEGEHALDLAPVSCTPCHDALARRVAGSAHAELGMECSACHGGHDIRPVHDADAPVAKGRQIALCARCHGDIADARTDGIHAVALAGRTCSACHDPHAAAAPSAFPEDRTCLECHADPDIAPAPDPLVGPPDGVAASVHGTAGIRCVLCHTGLQDAESFPHGAPEGGVSCAGCHADAADAWQRGVHAGAGRPAATCTDCHGAHAIQPAGDPRSRLYPLAVPDTCERCHGGDGSAPSAGEYETSVHARALRRGGLLVSATCSSCHGSHEIRAVADPDSPTSRRSVPYTCGACHAGVLATYLEGVHGQDFLEGVNDVPVCTDCHGEHGIEDPMREGSRVSAVLVAETCARCHGDSEFAERHGLRPGALATWGRSYHGIASGYGDRAAANCASCHGHHDIFPSTDPRSSVNAANLQATCGGCHAGATKAFAQVPVHSEVDRDGNYVAWLVRTVYLYMIAGVIGLFLLFIAIDLYGRVRLRLGYGPRDEDPVDPAAWPDEDELVPPGETFPRFGLTARLQHGLLVTSFMLLVLTGLPLLLHDIPLLRSALDFEGGFRLRSQLHRAGAVGLIGLSAWHVVSILLAPKGRRWFATMIFRPRDVTDFLQEAMYHLGLLDWLSRRAPLAPLFARHPWLACRTRPRYDTYSLVEKLEYAAVLWGNLVMIASGALLWKPGWFLGWLPVWAFELARVVHGYEATLAFLAIIVWHMYHVHLRPDVFPMSRVWLTGRISREELREHHTAKYLRLLERRRAAGREARPR